MQYMYICTYFNVQMDVILLFEFHNITTENEIPKGVNLITSPIDIEIQRRVTLQDAEICEQQKQKFK